MGAVAIDMGTTTGGGAVAMRSRRPAPVDLVHLARQTFGSLELEREVLGLFVGQGSGLVRRIAASEGAERAALVHRLKGSARGIGAARVAQLCEALEAPAIDEDEMRHLVDGLAEAVVEVEGFVRGLV